MNIEEIVKQRLRRGSSTRALIFCPSCDGEATYCLDQNFFKCHSCGISGGYKVFLELCGEDHENNVYIPRSPIKKTEGFKEWEASVYPEGRLIHGFLGSPSSTWEIKDRYGRLFGIHARFDGHKKIYSWWRDGSWGLSGTPLGTCPLYMEHIPCFGRRLIICEGEKATDCLVGIGIESFGVVSGALTRLYRETVIPTVNRFDEIYFWPDADRYRIVNGKKIDPPGLTCARNLRKSSGGSIKILSPRKIDKKIFEMCGVRPIPQKGDDAFDAVARCGNSIIAEFLKMNLDDFLVSRKFRI